MAPSRLKTRISYRKQNYFNKKLSAKELHSILVSNVEYKPKSQAYLEKIFWNKLLKWDKWFLLERSFQYRIMNNMLYLNTKFYSFQLTSGPLSFCKTENETTSFPLLHFNSPTFTWLEPDSTQPDLLIQVAIFAFPELNCHYFLLF